MSDLPALGAVIGTPIAQSLSPAIHAEAFAEFGHGGHYEAIDCGLQEMSATVSDLVARGACGFSVTMPLKESVVALCDELDPVAATLGAVNCVSCHEGTLVGHNTDGDGCCDALETVGGLDVEGKNVLVLGAGGTARSVCLALAARGARIVVRNRTWSRSEELIAMVRGAVPGATIVGGVADFEIGFDALVNTTSVGMGTDEAPLDSTFLHAGLVVLDAVYHPLQTALLKAAESAGAVCVDGLWMLVHQARRQQKIWFGVSSSAANMRSAALRALADRRQ